jgi:hypothetical protein
MSDWIRFHRALVSVRRRLVVADFQEVTEDFGSVVTRLNSFYGTAFAPFLASEENVRKCFDMIEELHRSRRGGAVPDEMQVARPSAKRELPRLALLERLSSARYGESRDQADSLYAEFTLELTGTTGLAQGLRPEVAAAFPHRVGKGDERDGGRVDRRGDTPRDG